MGALLPFHRYLLLLFFYVVHISCQEIGNSVTNIQFRTGSQGGSGETLSLSVNWSGTKFVCTKTPNRANKPFSCNPSSNGGTSNAGYYIYLDWDRTNSPLQITEFIVTDNKRSTYTIQKFCHSSIMQCDSPGPWCSQWGSKISSNQIELGSNTKFGALYVDIPIFGARFANKIVEGGVRPPNLVSAGFTTGTGPTGVGAVSHVSIQWDTGLYQCEIEPNTADVTFTCVLSDPLHCPAMTDFWMSIYSNQNGGDILHVAGISFEDETSSTYTFSQGFVREPGSDQTDCDTSCTEILIGGQFMGYTFEKLVPFFVPDCLFDFPDPDSYGAAVDVGVGSVITATPNDNEFGWDTAEYGGPIDPICPETPEPTYDPTREPTTDPTPAPTTDPTPAPTPAPTTDPTSAPTPAPTPAPSPAPTTPPTNAPSLAPTTPPTAAPTDAPTLAPSLAPSSSPTSPPSATPTSPPSRSPSHDPTQEPTAGPTSDPTTEPTNDPTTEPTFDPTHDPTQEPTTARPTFDIPIQITLPNVQRATENTPIKGTDIGPVHSNALNPFFEIGWWILIVVILALCVLISIVVLAMMYKKGKFDVKTLEVEVMPQSPQSESPKAQAQSTNKRKKKKISHKTTPMGGEKAVQQQIMKEVAQLMSTKKKKKKPHMRQMPSIAKSEGLPHFEVNLGNTMGEGQHSFMDERQKVLLQIVGAEDDEEVLDSEYGVDTSGKGYKKKAKKNIVFNMNGANDLEICDENEVTTPQRYSRKRKKKKKQILYNMNPHNDQEICGSEVGDVTRHSEQWKTQKKSNILYNMNANNDQEIVGNDATRMNPMNPRQDKPVWASEMGTTTDRGQTWGHLDLVMVHNNQMLYQEEDDNVVVTGMMTLGDIVLGEEPTVPPPPPPPPPPPQ
eukprot:97276_1